MLKKNAILKRVSCQRFTRLQRYFRENLRVLRESANMTQDDLSAKMRVPRSYVSDLERGRNSPTLPVLENIAKSLNVCPSKLLRQPGRAKKKPD